MITALRQAGSFSRPVTLLLVNQVGINLGFFMLMPYLASYLTGPAGLAVWVAGLILGVRNFSQQGMFLLGGTLADRIGCRPLIVAGCGLRVVGFALFGASTEPAVLIAAAILTGLAGALFNPAARAYIAVEAGDRKTEAFAIFNVFYQLGVLLGPLAGIALLGAGFRAVCLAAAAIFALLTVMQWRLLPAQPRDPDRTDRPVLTDWREALRNRAFMRFAVVMFASYALSFQIYLGLPLEVERLTGHQYGMVLVFAVQAGLALLGQVRLTRWATARWGHGQILGRGLALMGTAFVPLALAAAWPPSGVWRLAPVLAAAALLALGTMLVFPVEMTVITELASGRLIGTYYGLYNLLSGIGILAGNMLSGAALDVARAAHLPWAPWLLLAATGGGSAVAIWALDRRAGLLGADSGTSPTPHPTEPSVGARPR